MDNNSESGQDWIGKTLYVCKTRWTTWRNTKVKVIARFVSGECATLYLDKKASVCILHRIVEAHAARLLKIDFHSLEVVLFSGDCKLKRCPDKIHSNFWCKTLADYHAIGNDEDFVVTVVVQEDKLPQLNESHSGNDWWDASSEDDVSDSSSEDDVSK